MQSGSMVTGITDGKENNCQRQLTVFEVSDSPPIITNTNTKNS
jgi:hypothetical protein